MHLRATNMLRLLFERTIAPTIFSAPLTLTCKTSKLRYLRTIKKLAKVDHPMQSVQIGRKVQWITSRTPLSTESSNKERSETGSFVKKVIVLNAQHRFWKPKETWQVKATEVKAHETSISKACYSTNLKSFLSLLLKAKFAIPVVSTTAILSLPSSHGTEGTGQQSTSLIPRPNLELTMVRQKDYVTIKRHTTCSQYGKASKPIFKVRLYQHLREAIIFDCILLHYARKHQKKLEVTLYFCNTRTTLAAWRQLYAQSSAAIINNDSGSSKSSHPPLRSRFLC